MRALLLALLLLAAFPLAPSATAHQCSSSSSSSDDCVCPAPNDGQAHQHAYPGGACQGFAGAQQSATPGGASQGVPGPAIALVLLGISAAALVARRT